MIRRAGAILMRGYPMAMRMFGLMAMLTTFVSAAGLSNEANAACLGNAVIEGKSQINESDADVQYTYTCDFQGGLPNQPILWEITAGGASAEINPLGQLTPKPISGNRAVTIRSWDLSGKSTTKQIGIINNVPTLDGAASIIKANGSYRFVSGSTHYINKAAYELAYLAVIGGVENELTSASGLSWSGASGGATISSGGVLNTTGITTNSTQNIVGTYTYTPSGYPHLSRTLAVSWPSMHARARLPTLFWVERTPAVSQVSENKSQVMQFQGKLAWDDDSVSNVSPTWSENSAFASISQAGALSTSSVTSPQTVVVTGQFRVSTAFSGYPDYATLQTVNTAPITILNDQLLISALTISGPTSVDESSTANYTASVKFDGVASEIVPLWSENSSFATIDSSGVLSSSAVTANTNVNVSASYTYEGTTLTTSKPVTINNTESVLHSVEISGPSTINENDSETYTATGTFDDGTRAITPVWGGGSPHASIDSNGVLTAGEVVGDEAVQVSATYTHLGVQRQASRVITVLNSERSVSALRIVGGDNVLVGPSASSQFTALAMFDDAVGEAPVSAQWSVTRANGSAISPAQAQVSISSDGVLTVASVSQDLAIAVHASYVNTHSGGNQTVTASKPLVLSVSHDGDGLTKRISVNSDGGQVGAGSRLPSVSADGRFVAFASTASNVVPNDVNAVRDVFLHDRYTGEVRRLSVDFADSLVGGDGASDKPAISADGRIVVFVSTASNLVPDDGNALQDVFAYDRLTGVVERVSAGVNGAASDGVSDHPSVSADGRYVAFSSLATNLVSGDTNARRDIFVYDRLSGTTERVSLRENGTQANGHSQFTAISADGRHVAFVSSASNMVAGDTNAVADVFVRDRVAATTERVSVSTAGVQGDGASQAPRISGDGRYVVFASDAANLVGDDTNGVTDVFIRDRDAGTSERVSINGSDQQGDGQSVAPSISADGRYVAFSSDAVNLVGGDANGVSDVFVRDRETGTIQRASTSGGSVESGAASTDAAMTADGRHVIFTSLAAQLVPGDTNGGVDVFVRTLSTAFSQPRIWIETPDESVDVTEAFTVDLFMDFSNDPTLGGGIDIAYDGNAVFFDSFAADPQAGADPAFSRAPDVLSVILPGLAFGEYEGLAGPLRVGTLTFTAQSEGETSLTLSTNSAPMGSFYSARTLTEQPVDFFGGTVTVGASGEALHITSAPITNAVVGVPYGYDVDAMAGAGGGALTFVLTTAPSGMSIDANSGLIQWTPSSAGSYPVVVQVSDGVASITQGYAIAVSSSGGSGTVTHSSTQDFAEGGSGSGVRAVGDGLRLSMGAPGLVALWHLDNDWADATDGGYDGTGSGGAGFTSASKVGSHAAQFGSASAAATVASDGFLPQGAGSNLTVSFWFKHDTWYEFNPLIAHTGNIAWSVGTTEYGPLDAGMQGISCPGSMETNDGLWHHYALVFDDTANTLRGYVDGSWDCGVTASFSLPAPQSGQLTLGGGFTGALDEVAVYNRALSVAEIQALATTPAIPVDYAEEGSYLSDVIDLGSHEGLSTLVFSATTPAGTTLAVDVRAGDTVSPPSWGNATAEWPANAVITNVQSGVSGNISALGMRRYLQYRVRMTSLGDNTPTLDDITFHLTAGSSPVSAPYITSAPVTTATLTVPYSYDVDATAGSGGGPLSYSLEQAPSGMTINATTGLIQWTPNSTGSHTVVVKVADAGAYVSQGYSLTVEGIAGSGSVTHTTAEDFGAGVAESMLIEGDGLRLSIGAPGLVGLWHLDNDWADATDGGYDGAASGGAGFTSASKVGSHAAQFGSGAASASVASDGFLPQGAGSNLTAAFWFKHDTWYEFNPLIAHTGNIAWSVGTTEYGPLDAGMQGISCPGSMETNDGLWHHYALVFDDTANTLRGYVDGSWDCGVTASFSLPAPQSGQLTLGGGFTGALDEVAVYNRALSVAEIQALVATPAVPIGYMPEASYLSDVIDLGAAQELSLLVYDATTPAGTSVLVDLRAGDTASPPAWGSATAEWPANAVLANVQSAADVSALGERRYVQYRVRMTSTGANTPRLEELTVYYGD
jgi:Tol biopolymer transport system component